MAAPHTGGHGFPGQLTELSWSQAQNVVDLRAQVHAIGRSLLALKLGHCLSLSYAGVK